LVAKKKKKKKRIEKITSTRIVRSLLIVAAAAILMGLFAKVMMNSLNKKMGIELAGSTSNADSSVSQETYESVSMPEFDPSTVVEVSSSVWVPEWKLSVCSLFVTMDSGVLYDSLPQAPEDFLQRTELQLLVELWAEYAEFDQNEIERAWIFSSGDTCFVDLPRSADWQAIAETIKGRFVSYSLLIPFISGEIVEGMEEGIPVTNIYSAI